MNMKDLRIGESYWVRDSRSRSDRPARLDLLGTPARPESVRVRWLDMSIEKRKKFDLSHATDCKGCDTCAPASRLQETTIGGKKSRRVDAYDVKETVAGRTERLKKEVEEAAKNKQALQTYQNDLDVILDFLKETLGEPYEPGSGDRSVDYNMRNSYIANFLHDAVDPKTKIVNEKKIRIQITCSLADMKRMLARLG